MLLLLLLLLLSSTRRQREEAAKKRRRRLAGTADEESTGKKATAVTAAELSAGEATLAKLAAAATPRQWRLGCRPLGTSERSLMVWYRSSNHEKEEEGETETETKGAKTLLFHLGLFSHVACRPLHQTEDENTQEAWRRLAVPTSWSSLPFVRSGLAALVKHSRGRLPLLNSTRQKGTPRQQAAAASGSSSSSESTSVIID
mmetsp:Transcript_43336/g.73709  ORF Transcript_43336/g.73709 Transcript_43336/m.73709 type:complete len:201 (-) Transcript_43336:153-755(-)